MIKTEKENGAGTQQPLEEWRRSSYLTQTELAERAGVDKATISRIESGTHKGIKLSTARKIAEALGINPSQIKEFIPLLETKKENRLMELTRKIVQAV